MAACGACGQVFPNRLQVGAHARTCRAIRHFLQPPITDQVDLDAEDADIAPITLHSLARRPAHPWGIECDVAMPDLPVGNSPFTRDYRPVSSKCVASIFFILFFLLVVQMQEIWSTYVQDSFNACDPKFWLLLAAVQNESTTCRDRVFAQVKDLMEYKGQKWPRTCRTL